jgi:hypothetical protein
VLEHHGKELFTIARPLMSLDLEMRLPLPEAETLLSLILVSILVKSGSVETRFSVSHLLVCTLSVHILAGAYHTVVPGYGNQGIWHPY